MNLWRKVGAIHLIHQSLLSTYSVLGCMVDVLGSNSPVQAILPTFLNLGADILISLSFPDLQLPYTPVASDSNA